MEKKKLRTKVDMKRERERIKAKAPTHDIMNKKIQGVFNTYSRSMTTVISMQMKRSSSTLDFAYEESKQRFDEDELRRIAKK